MSRVTSFVSGDTKLKSIHRVPWGGMCWNLSYGRMCFLPLNIVLEMQCYRPLVEGIIPASMA